MAKPPWHARDQRERELMFQWVLDTGDRQVQADLVEAAEKFGKRLPEWKAEARRAHAEYRGEIRAAEIGNIEPLRKRFPLIAKFINLPPGYKPKRRPKPISKAMLAARAVKFIRALWQREYGRKNRRPDDGQSALEIAARIFNVSVSEIAKKMKPSGPSGKRKKVSRAD
jgi:hypothetical protein